ncbi:calmodulin-binding transcription activator 2-like isoform X1 [Senna tora]|uniref:Calmodulin-binding transcription activator 2-like isoform X1 n=1 Tax=Senna tora TaxID=362788 RepID=A0A834XD44_9FABA|nr:calmodulin-binding transcription activator 2-like isoform X1 [Senna tora]
MAERASYGVGPRLVHSEVEKTEDNPDGFSNLLNKIFNQMIDAQIADLQQLQYEAQHRWLRPAEICEILRNYRMFHITPEPPNRPPSGSLFLFDRKVLRYFRKDGHNWRKKKDGKTVKEAHEKLKVGSVDVLHCYYAHGEENENFQRRSYWMLEPDMMHIVFVHYLEVKGNKTNIGGNTDNDEVTSDSQKSRSPSSSFPTNYSNVPSRSTDAMSPTSTLSSLCEDADSGDHGQSSNSGTNYIPLVPGDNSRSNTSFIEGQNMHGMGSWGNVLDQCTAGLPADPSVVSFPSIPSSIGNILEQDHSVLGDLFAGKGTLTEEAGTSQSLQSNWQIPFEDNSGQLNKWPITQLLSSEFGSDFSTGLLQHESHNANPEIAPDLLTFNGQLREQPVQENLSKQYTDGQSQLSLRSNSESEVPSEESINYAFTMKRTLLDGEDSLKKVDSFSRWISKELGEVADLHMQSSPGISWSTDESGQVIDDSSLSPSLSHDQLFSIYEFSPKWAYAESETEVLIIGTFLKSQPEVANCNWSCMFGEVEVPAEVLANGILCCHAPPHKNGRVPFYVTRSNRLACSEVREFDYREGFVKDVEVEEFCSNSFEMLLHLRFEDLLSLKSVHPSNGKSCDSDTDKRSLIYKLISLKEEEEYSNKEDPTLDTDLSQHKEHLFHRQAKEKLYSWLLHKVAEDGTGPNILDEEGQGVLHLAAALGYDWAIAPIIISGVNINFRDVNGWTALHWAASCGRERTVALLLYMGAAPGAVTDPSPAFPAGRTPADLASSNGHKGISGFLAESSLTSHLASLTMDDLKEGGGLEGSGMKAVQTVSERSATPVFCGDIPETLCLKDSLTAVRNATQAADRIHQVFRMQSFHRKQLAEYEDDELDQRALSLLASKASKAGQGDGLAHAAATQIQKNSYWPKELIRVNEFLTSVALLILAVAHVRGHQVRKQYKSIIWSVGILEKVILRWRRKGSGLRGFRPDAVTKDPSPQSEPLKEDDYDFLKEGRKQSEERFQKALSRVKSMVQYPEARAQYRRLLNVVEDFRQTKACNMDLTNSEETVDGVEQLIDIDMLLDDDNFIPIAFN